MTPFVEFIILIKNRFPYGKNALYSCQPVSCHRCSQLAVMLINRHLRAVYVFEERLYVSPTFQKSQRRIGMPSAVERSHLPRTVQQQVAIPHQLSKSSHQTVRLMSATKTDQQMQ